MTKEQEKALKKAIRRAETKGRFRSLEDVKNNTNLNYVSERDIARIKTRLGIKDE